MSFLQLNKFFYKCIVIFFTLSLIFFTKDFAWISTWDEYIEMHTKILSLVLLVSTAFPFKNVFLKIATTIWAYFFCYFAPHFIWVIFNLIFVNGRDIDFQKLVFYIFTFTCSSVCLLHCFNSIKCSFESKQIGQQ